MRGSVTINPRGSNTSSNSGGVGNYLDLPDRPDELIEETTVPAVTAGGEFVPSNDNSNKAAVSITDGGSTITTTRTNNAWGGSGTFSAELIPVANDGYVSFKLTQSNKRFMVGLSRTADASSTTYSTIDYAIYVTGTAIQVYENSSNKYGNSATFNVGSTYKIQKIGTTVTYLKDDVVFYTSGTSATRDLHMDTAFLNTGSTITEVKMLTAPVTITTPETVKYTLDLKNPNVIGYHVDELVSDTNFADIATALADDAVKAAIAGDFVEIDSRIYHVIKTNPTLAIHLKLNDEKIEDATNAEVTAGTSQDFVLFSPFQIHEKATAVSTALIDAIPATKYSDIVNRPNTLISETVVPTVTAERGEFVPDNDNSNKIEVSIADGGSTLTTTRASNDWGGSGTFSTDVIPAADDGYLSFKLTQRGKYYLVGLSNPGDVGSTSYNLIDYAIFSANSAIQIYENANVRYDETSTFNVGSTYKIQKTGTTITYLKDDVVFYTSTVASNLDLHMDTSFYSTGSTATEIKMSSTTLVTTPEHLTYTLDYNSDLLLNKPAGGGSTTAQATDGEVDAGTETEARLFTPKQIDTKAKSVLPTQATQAEMTAGTEEGVKGMSPKQIKDATDALISAIPASGGGTASNIAWENVTNLPAFLNTTNQPESVNPVFVNSGGVTVTQSASGADVECTAAGWGNSGTWDEDNSILADGAVSFIITSVPSNSEQMLGLSYKNSEADATSLTFTLIDHSWYFRRSDRKAFIRETNSSGTGNNNVSDYTGKVFDAFETYSINRVGNKVNYLIDGVIVYTSSKNSSGTLHVDLALNRVNSAFSQIRIQRNLTNIYETKLDYSDPGVINKPKYLQEVRTSYSDEHEVALAGATAYHITGLDVNIVPKRATSKFVISFDVKACAPIGHIFSLSIYIDDTKINAGTTALHNVDAVVPVPETSGGLSVLNSVTGSLETSHSPVLNNMTVRIYAWYHKDSVATDATSLLTFNRAKRNISGLAYKMQGTSMLRVEEIEV